jgi:hypothetical protein
MGIFTERTSVKARIAFSLLIVAYLAVLVPFTSHLKNRPVAVKLGYLPEAEVLKITFADYRNLLAQYSVIKVLFYFGTLVETFERKVPLQPEYFNMFKIMQTTVKLDPYNMDAYYFTQAAFTWELRKIREVNDLLEYGMKYRTWDYQLPFFIAFNAAYFQKDYKTAAVYMKKAAELSHNPLFTNLTARYFYEAGQTGLGLIFLDAMVKGTSDPKVKRLYVVRKDALKSIKTIEDAVSYYVVRNGKPPADLASLVAEGFLDNIPHDPYGGTFFIDLDGSVRSTSKLAFPVTEQ